MNQSGLQALKLLTEAGRVWSIWRSLDDSSKQNLKDEGAELKEAVSEARSASLAAIQRTRNSLKQKGLVRLRVKALDQSPSSLRRQEILETFRREPDRYWSTDEICEKVGGDPKSLPWTLALAALWMHGFLVQDDGREKYKYKTEEDWLATFPEARANRMHETFLQEYVDACMAEGFIVIREKGLPSQEALGLEDERLKSVVGAALEQGFREGVLCFYDLKGLTGRKMLIGLPPELLEGLEPNAEASGQDAPSVVAAASRLAKAGHKLTTHLRELQADRELSYGKNLPQVWAHPLMDLSRSDGSTLPQLQNHPPSTWDGPPWSGPLPPTSLTP